MRKQAILIIAVTLMGLSRLVGASTAQALSTIDSTDIFAMPASPPNSGNGLLGIIMFGFTGGGGVNENDENDAHPGFPAGIDLDDANTNMPTGGSTTAVNEAWVTSMGEIQDFYKYTFPDGSGGSSVNQIVLFVDINETGGPPNFIALSTLDIITGYASPAANPVGSDISSSTQNAITDGAISGGTLEATRGAGTPYTLQQVNTGADSLTGSFLTGINPFSFPASAKVLFNWGQCGHG